MPVAHCIISCTHWGQIFYEGELPFDCVVFSSCLKIRCYDEKIFWNFLPFPPFSKKALQTALWWWLLKQKWGKWEEISFSKNILLSYGHLPLTMTEVGNFWFLPPLVLSNWEVPQLSHFWGKCVYFSIFEWSQHNISVNFIIQRLKNKIYKLRKLRNLSFSTEQEVTKTKYFAP